MIFRQSYIFLLILFTTTVISSCSNKGFEQKTNSNNKHKDVITTTISGKAESPDPVLTKVLLLEKQGLLSNVRIMESFPVQITITGSKDLIESLGTRTK